MPFLTIPSTGLGASMGKVFGKATGKASASLMKVLDKAGSKAKGVVRDKIEVIKAKAVEKAREEALKLKDKAIQKAKEKASELKDQAINEAQESGALDTADKVIKEVRTTLDTVLTSTNTVIDSTSVLKTTSTVIKMPIKVAEVAMTVIKALPIPQMYQVMSATILQSDALFTLLEVVKQAEDTADYLVNITDSVINTLMPYIKKVEEVKRILDGIDLSSKFQSALNNVSDTTELKNKGLIDEDGVDIFLKLSDMIPEGGLMTIGDISPLDLTTITSQNMIGSTDCGGTVNIPVTSTGDWVATVYLQSENQPVKPISREVPPSPWTINQGLGSKWWSSTATVSGLTGKAGVWSEPVQCEDVTVVSNVEIPKVETKTIKVKCFSDSIVKDIADSSSTGSSNPTVYRLSGDEAYQLMGLMLDELGYTGIGRDIKEEFGGLFNVGEQEVQDKQTVFFWKDYTIKIVEDQENSHIVPIHYTEVYDKAGVLVFTGVKSYTQNYETLVEDTKVKLLQLTL